MREHSKAALAVFGAFFLALIIGIVFSLKILLWPVLVGFLIAFILDPIVDYFEAKDVNRVFIICVLIFSLLGLLFTAVFLFVEPVVHQVRHIVNEAPAYSQLLRSGLLDLVRQLQARYPGIDWVMLYGKGVDAAFQYVTDLWRSMPHYFTNLFGIIASAIIVPFVTFFLLKDGEQMKKQVIELVPNRYFEMTLTLFYRVSRQLTAYLRGTLLDCGIISVLYVIGYSIVGVKYSVFIGLLAGVLNLVPYVGPWMGGALAVVIVLFDPSAPFPWWSALIVASLVQFVENNFIYPVVLGKSVNIHPLIIMFGLFVGAEVAGLVGMVLAVPLIAILKVVSEVLYKGLRKFSVI